MSFPSPLAPKSPPVSLVSRGIKLATPIEPTLTPRSFPNRSIAGYRRAQPYRREHRSPLRQGLRARLRGFRVVAMAEKKPKILRENEKEAWLSEMEREGANPFKDPMAIVGILGITFPFVILAVAGAAGYIGQ